MGYNNATTQFKTLEPGDKEWGPYLGIMKKFPLESNAFGLIDALDALLVFVENSGCANR